MEYEQVFLKGVPFLRDTDGNVYNYDRARPIAIGRLDAGGELCLAADWRERLEPALIAWRASLAPCERGKIKPEAKVKKQSKPRKAAGGAGGSAAPRAPRKKGGSRAVHSDDE